jgi:hypothetical protein
MATAEPLPYWLRFKAARPEHRLAITKLAMNYRATEELSVSDTLLVATSFSRRMVALIV